MKRHIRYRDVLDIKPIITTEFILRLSFRSFINLVCTDQVTLVPDSHDAITSNAGWDTLKFRVFLADIVTEFRRNGIRTSLFADTNPVNIKNAVLTGTDRVETVHRTI